MEGALFILQQTQKMHNGILYMLPYTSLVTNPKPSNSDLLKL